MRKAFKPPQRRRVGAIIALVLLAAVASIAVNGLASASPTSTSAGPTSTSTSAARLALKQHNPATVSGTGFAPRARVRVTFVGAQTFVRRPVTNARGAFTATFPTVADRCTSWSVTAIQPGRAAVRLRGPKPECAPASTP